MERQIKASEIKFDKWSTTFQVIYQPAFLAELKIIHGGYPSEENIAKTKEQINNFLDLFFFPEKLGGVETPGLIQSLAKTTARIEPDKSSGNPYRNIPDDEEVVPPGDSNPEAYYAFNQFKKNKLK